MQKNGELKGSRILEKRCRHLLFQKSGVLIPMLLLGHVLPYSTSLLVPTPIPVSAAPSSRGFHRTSSFISPSTATAATTKSTDGDSSSQREFCDSDRILYIGNLDWSVPAETYERMFSGVIDNLVDDEKHARRTDAGLLPASIRIKERSNRPRDRNKCHGGSATVSFGTPVAALDGQKALQALADSQDFRIRWARTPMIRSNGIQNGTATPNTKRKKNSSRPLTAEQWQHRKERAESYARKRQRVAQKTDAILSTVLATSNDIADGATIRKFLDVAHLDMDGQIGSKSSISLHVLDAPPLDWSSCPPGLDPLQGGGLVRNARGLRKQAAVEAFSFVVKEALVDRTVSATAGTQQWVADLGCGAGNLALPLAWQLCSIGYRVAGVDFNQQSLDRLARRAKEAGVIVEALNLDLLRLIVEEDSSDNEDNNYLEDCAAVVSLHACGAASDLAMASAVRHSLPFAISPCCIGKVNTSRTVKENKGKTPHLETAPSETFKRRGAPKEIEYPRSNWLRSAVPLMDDFRLLASAADYGVNGSSDEAQELVRRQRCQSAKRIVEADRLEWARERGYYVRMLELPRIGPHYPKRELLLGAKEGSAAARRIHHLPTTHVLSDSLIPI